MGLAVGSMKRITMNPTHAMAIQPMAALYLPRFHSPIWKSGLSRRSRTGVMYAMYSPITAMEVTAKYAVVLFSAGLARTSEQTVQSQMELVGVPVRRLTFAHSSEPGSAPSRENAYVIREFAVTDAMPQKYCATPQMKMRKSPSLLPAASTKICAAGSPVELPSSAVWFWIAAVTARS